MYHLSIDALPLAQAYCSERGRGIFFTKAIQRISSSYGSKARKRPIPAWCRFHDPRRLPPQIYLMTDACSTHYVPNAAAPTTKSSSSATRSIATAEFHVAEECLSALWKALHKADDPPDWSVRPQFGHCCRCDLGPRRRLCVNQQSI